MSFFSNSSDVGSDVDSRSMGLDLNAIMRQVYLWMGLGLLVAFGIAFILGNAAANEIYAPAASLGNAPTSTGVADFLFNPVVSIVALIAYIGLAFTIQPIINRMSVAVGSVVYLLFTALFGFMLADIFIVYNIGTIALAFGATAGMFGAMTIVGYTTKVDLSRFGGILIMALIGLVIASFLNILFHSAALEWIISYAGVLIFVALTAYDTQWIKRTALQAANSGNTEWAAKIALIGALHLFLDFVNLFMFILRILGGGGRGRR